MTPAGIEPATFRFVAQHLNHCATAVPTEVKYCLDNDVVKHYTQSLSRNCWDGQEINRILRDPEGQLGVTGTCPNACIAAVCLEHLNGMTLSCCRNGRVISPDVIQFCTVLK